MWTQRNIRHGPDLQEIYILFQKISEVYLGKKETGLYEQCLKNPDYHFTVPLSEQYPIMHHYIILDTDNSECPIMQKRHCRGENMIWCLLFKTAVSAKGVAVGEMNKNWLPHGQRRCDRALL